MTPFDRRVALYAYTAAVDLARYSNVPSIREAAQRRAEALAKELQNV